MAAEAPNPILPIKLEPPGQRERVDAARAEEFVKLWTQQLIDHLRDVTALGGTDNADLTNVVLCDRIRLSDKSYSAEAALIIASFLTSPFRDGIPIAHGILEADLSDIIASRSTEEGLQVLKTICDAFADSKLVDVKLGDNAIGDQGIGSCRTVLNKITLEKLELINNGLSEATMAEVAEILTNNENGIGSIAANLTKIHFHNNMSGDGGCNEFVRILEESTRLEDVRFSGTRAGPTGSAMVASALDVALSNNRNPNLSRLDLCDCNFKDKVCHETLFRALGATTSLRYLNLRDCDLEDEGVRKVCHALFNSESELEHLDLSGNCVTHRGAKHIADYIRDSLGALKVLHLDDNEMTSKGVVLIARAFHGGGGEPALEELKLCATMCGGIGARALIDAYGPEGRDLPNLRNICLNENSFKEDVVAELRATFQDKLDEMEDNDSDGEADDDLTDDEEDEEDESGGAVGDGAEDDISDDEDAPVARSSVDNLADIIGSTLIV